MDSTQFNYHTLSGPGQIRLVTILPGDRGANLELQLQHTDLGTNLNYECLSYAWGPVGQNRPITLNNSSFPVSTTLYTALEHLRHTQQQRKMWIDAISINQSDISERSHQVAIMRRIYQNATRVIVWLGPASETSEQAMAFLKMMGSAEKSWSRRRVVREDSDTSSESPPNEEKKRHQSLPAETSPKESSNGLYQDKGAAFWKRLLSYSLRLLAHLERLIFHKYHQAVATQKATKNDFLVTGFPVLYDDSYNSCAKYFTNEWESHWQALDELLARPWWGRTWIVQEVWCASEAVIQCGDTTIKWNRFRRAMDYSEAWDEMGGLIKGTQRGQNWDALRRQYTLAINLAKARVNGRTLATLLVTTWDRASTDPRDKVFAMLLLVGGDETVSMVPDYSKSTGQVYREVAHHIIAKQGQLDILLAASGANGNAELPTWVPDWRCEAVAKKPRLLVNRHLLMKLYFTGSMDRVVLNGHGYRAAGNSKPFASFSNDLSVLTVLSQKLDRIAEVCEADIAEVGDTEFGKQTFDFIVRSKAVTAKTRRRESEMHNNTDELKNTSVLLTTLTAGGKIKGDKRAPTIRNIMERRRLFVTQEGQLGIGPMSAQPGDVVFIISGCNFPIVLRPTHEEFAVVGEAYIHGRMNGEGLARTWYRPWVKAWREISLV